MIAEVVSIALTVGALGVVNGLRTAELLVTEELEKVRASLATRSWIALRSLLADGSV